MFDGKAPQLKSGELIKRAERRKEAEAKLAEAKETQDQGDINKFNKRLVRVTRQHNEDCKKLLRLLGLPIIESPSEAEAQCAQLCKEGLVYGTATEDMDGLTFGSPRLVRNLTSGSTEKVKEYVLEKVLNGLGLNQKQFIDLGILMGCDYCESIKGIGGKKGLELIKKYGSIEDILEKKFGITSFVDVVIDYGDRKEEEVKIIEEEEEVNGKSENENDNSLVEEQNTESELNGTKDDENEETKEDDDKDETKEDDDKDEIETKQVQSDKKKGKKSKESKEKIPQNWLFLGARKLFEEPNVFKDVFKESDLKQKDIEEEALVKFLCEENGFSEDRVKNAIKRVKDAKGKTSQTRIDTFFKILPSTNNNSVKKEIKKETGTKRGSSSKDSNSSKRGRKPK